MRCSKRIYELLLIFTLGAATSQPAASQPVDGPTATVQKYFSLINNQDRKAALALWDTTGPDATDAVGVHVDMMLALARLKKAAVDRWGFSTLYDLHMAVIHPDECGNFSETRDGNSATVTVAANDPAINPVRPADSYPMTRVNGKWLLKISEENVKNCRQELAAAAELIGLVDEVGKDVKAGRCADASDVLKHISDGMPSP